MPVWLFLLAALAGAAYRVRHFREFSSFYFDDAVIADFGRILADTGNLGQSAVKPGAAALLAVSFRLADLVAGPLASATSAALPTLAHALMGTAAVVFAGLLARRLYSSEAAGALAAALMAGSFWAQFYSKLHVAPSAAFFLLAAWLYARARDSGRLAGLGGAGLAAGAAFTIHYDVLVYAAALFAFEAIVVVWTREPWRPAARRLLMFSCFMALPALLLEAYIHLRWSISGLADPLNALYLARVVNQLLFLHRKSWNYPPWFFTRLFFTYEGAAGALLILGAVGALVTGLAQRSWRSLMAPLLFVLPVAFWVARIAMHALTTPRSFFPAMPFGMVALAGLLAPRLERRRAVLVLLVALILTDGYFKYRVVQQGHTGVDAAVRSLSHVPGTPILFQGNARTAHLYFGGDAVVIDNPFFFEQMLVAGRARYLVCTWLDRRELRRIEALLARHCPRAAWRDFPSPAQTFLPIVLEEIIGTEDLLEFPSREWAPPFVRVYDLRPEPGR